MSNRRKTADQRINQMLRNSDTKLAGFDTLVVNGAVLDKHQLQARYKAWKQNRKARRQQADLRDRQIKAMWADMQNRPPADPTDKEN